MYFVSFDKKKKSTFGLTCTIKSETNISVEVLTPQKNIYLWKQEDNLLLPHILIMLILLYFQGKKIVCNYCKYESQLQKKEKIIANNKKKEEIITKVTVHLDD